MEDEHTGREANKICGVCGDRALGYNFNAVSCESCKAFFRRNALKNKDFRCPFTENCTITPVTRRFCQKCRLDKCFVVGMRKEYIMSEEDKVLKRQKIELNRAKKRPSHDSNSSTKMKRESLEDSTFDDTSTSVPSVASVASESYFWESDKRYPEVDVSKEMDRASPVTAASVPSPSTPPENCDIVGSKTLEMLQDAQSTCVFVGYADHTDRCIPSDLNMNVENGPPGLVDVVVASREMETEVENFLTSQFKSQLPEFSTIREPSENTNLVEVCTGQDSDEAVACQKSKEICLKRPNLASKLMQEPELLVKAVSDPNIVAKIIQDQSILIKFMMDPQVINKITSDPQIYQLLEKLISQNSQDASESTEGAVDESATEILVQDGISDSMIKNMLDNGQIHVENPILTNLITNQSVEESQNQSSDNVSNGITVSANDSPSNNIDTSTSATEEINETTDDVTKDVLEEVQRIPITENSIESILCEAIKLEFSAYSTLGGNHNSRELNDAERAKLNELIVANKALLAPLDDDLANLVGEEYRFKGTSEKSDPGLLDVINLTAVAIRRLIKMAKKINAFKNMCQDDQIALLKGGCTEMMILRSAINYDPDKQIWKIPHTLDTMSKIKVDVLKEAKGNIYTEHAKFVGTFYPRWRDENIILILSAIALFSPDRARVVHTDVIKLEQNSYYYLLRRYLESIYPGCEAKSTFLKLIQKMSELHRLNDEVIGVYLNVNPSSVEPLLIEIFDLKQ